MGSGGVKVTTCTCLSLSSKDNAIKCALHPRLFGNAESLPASCLPLESSTVLESMGHVVQSAGVAVEGTSLHEDPGCHRAPRPARLVGQPPIRDR